MSLLREEVLLAARIAPDQLERKLDEFAAGVRRDALVNSPLAEAVIDLCWRAVPYGQTDDGDIARYLFTKGTVHRLIGAAQAAGIRAAFKWVGAKEQSDTDQAALDAALTAERERIAQRIERELNHAVADEAARIAREGAS